MNVMCWRGSSSGYIFQLQYGVLCG